MNNTAVSLVVGFGLAIASVSALAQVPPFLSEPPDSFIVFGDSLSDTGNAFDLSGGTNPESPPYFEGRFSNGPIWAEILPAARGVDPERFQNFAVGGAESGAGGPVGTTAQVQNFVDGGGSIGAETIVSVFAGANDLLNNVETTADPTTLVETVVTNTAMNIRALAQAGAQQFVVPNIPSLGSVPVGAASGSAQELTELSQLTNTALFDRLNDLESELGVDIIVADTDALFQAFRVDEETFGFTNTSTPCQGEIGTASPTGACATQEQEEETLFFDPLHPTTNAHEFFAQYVNGLLVANDQGPRVMASLAEFGIIAASSLHDLSDERLAALRSGFDAVTFDHGRKALGEDNIAAFISVEYGFGQRDDQPDFAAFDYDNYRVSAGVEYEATKHMMAGIAVSYLDGDAEFEGDLGRFDHANIGVTAYGTTSIDDFYLDLSFGFSIDDIEDFDRATGNTALPLATSNTEGNTFFVGLDAGYRYDIGPLSISPFGAFRFLNAEIDGFTEQGADLNAITVDDITADRYLVEGGVNFSGSFEANRLVWVPFLRAAVEHDFTDSSHQFGFQVAGDLPRRVSANQRDDTAFRLGGGMAISHGNGIEVIIDYDGAFGEDRSDQRFGLRARKRF